MIPREIVDERRSRRRLMGEVDGGSLTDLE